MKNLNSIQYDNTNVIVYVKTKESDRFEALSSIRDFIIAPSLMYAALFPIDKIERLKEYLAQGIDICIATNTTFQIRSAKDRKKVLFQLN